MRPHGSPAELEAHRRHAITLFDQGLAPVDVARRLGVDRRSVRRWLWVELPRIRSKPAR